MVPNLPIRTQFKCNGAIPEGIITSQQRGPWDWTQWGLCQHLCCCCYSHSQKICPNTCQKHTGNAQRWHCAYIGTRTAGSFPRRIQPWVRTPQWQSVTQHCHKLCVGAEMTPAYTYQLMVWARLQISCWGGSLAVAAAPSIASWCHLHVCSLEFDFPDCPAMLAPAVKWFITGRPWQGQEENLGITGLKILWQLTYVSKHSLLLPSTFLYQQKTWAFLWVLVVCLFYPYQDAVSLETT